MAADPPAPDPLAAAWATGALPESRGVHVELIGPQGIGKTTTLEAIPAEIRSRWLLRPELDRARHAPDVQARVLAAQHPSLPVYRDLIGLRTAHLMASALGSYALARALRKDAEFIMQDIFARAVPQPRGVLLDEGLAQVFGDQIAALPEAKARRIMAGRALVFLMPQAPQTAVARVRARAATTGYLADMHGGLDDAALARWAVGRQAPLEALARLATRLGLPVLRLRAEDALADNANALAAFAVGLAAAYSGPGDSGAGAMQKARGGISDAGLSEG